MKLISKIKKSIKIKLMNRLGGNQLERFVPNINLDCTRKQKKVLISYVDFYRSSRDIELGTVHTNRYELMQIIQCFIKLGYVIDVCDSEDIFALKEIEKKEYDVIFGLGSVFREAQKIKSAFTILYLTENPYNISYEREMKRIDYLYQRKGVKQSLYRTGRVFKEDEEKQANAVICICDEKMLDVENKKRVIPSAFLNRKFNISVTQKKKNNFVVLGTAGFVHKGNDLLIEVFTKHPEWNLYLCGHDNTKIIEELNYNIPANVIDCGYIDVYSEKFLEIANECMFILLPSCSEALPTGVITGMRHGLIPIIMHDNGLDNMDQYCFYFEDYRIEKIEEKIKEVVSISNEELENRSNKNYELANKEYTLERFSERMYKAIESFVG